jgi:hypothetical protein
MRVGRHRLDRRGRLRERAGRGEGYGGYNQLPWTDSHRETSWAANRNTGRRPGWFGLRHRLLVDVPLLQQQLRGDREGQRQGRAKRDGEAEVVGEARVAIVQDDSVMENSVRERSGSVIEGQ